MQREAESDHVFVDEHQFFLSTYMTNAYTVCYFASFMWFVKAMLSRWRLFGWRPRTSKSGCRSRSGAKNGCGRCCTSCVPMTRHAFSRTPLLRFVFMGMVSITNICFEAFPDGLTFLCVPWGYPRFLHTSILFKVPLNTSPQVHESVPGPARRAASIPKAAQALARVPGPDPWALRILKEPQAPVTEPGLGSLAA